MKIQPISTSAFQCPECNKLFSSEILAAKCIKKDLVKAAKERKLDTLEDERAIYKQSLIDKSMIVCNEAESIDDIKKLYVKYAKELLNVELSFTRFDFRFTESMSNSHACPLGGKTQWRLKQGEARINYAGWSGTVAGTIKLPKVGSSNSSRGFGDFTDQSRSSMWNYIRAFPKKPDLSQISCFDTGLEHTLYGIISGGGSTGSGFNCSASIFLDDFPKIKAKHKEFLEEESNKNKFEEIREDLYANHEMCVTSAISNDDEVNEFVKIADEAKTLHDQTIAKLKVARDNIRNAFLPMKKEIDKSLKAKLIYDEEKYKKLSETFNDGFHAKKS